MRIGSVPVSVRIYHLLKRKNGLPEASRVSSKAPHTLVGRVWIVQRTDEISVHEYR